VGRDPANRMALEYLMAHYLLTRHLEHFVTAWQTVDERALAGVDTVPVHWAEAIVIYEHRTRRKVDLRGRTIDPEVRRRTQAFIHIAEAPRWRNRQQAEDALADSYGRTYGYFLVFGISGVPGGGR